MLYFMMYLINKIINGEQFHVITIVNLIISVVSWIAALYFFKIEIKHWEVKNNNSKNEVQHIFNSFQLILEKTRRI